MSALDLAEPQALIHTPDSADGDWLHVVLLRRVKDAEWICLQPDASLVKWNLATHRIIALLRRAPFPEAVRGFVVEFQAPPNEGELSIFHAQAAQTAGLLGADGGSGLAMTRPGLSWRVSHPGSQYFGEQVDDAVMAADATGVSRGAMGLAFFHDEWLHVERVPDAELASWRNYIRSGPGRDPRIAGDVRDASGRPFVSLHDYLGMLRTVDRTNDPSWPHRGPSAAVELLHGVRGSGKELVQYDEHWANLSGIPAQSAVRHEHRSLFHTLALLQTYDQLDIPATAGGEFLCRRIVQIQRATKANPASPSFTGLHQMVAHTLDETGGLAVQAFTAHFAGVAEAEARVLKQNRLLRTELGGRGKTSGRGGKEDTEDDEEPASAATGGSRRGARRKAAASKKV